MHRIENIFHGGGGGASCSKVHVIDHKILSGFSVSWCNQLYTAGKGIKLDHKILSGFSVSWCNQLYTAGKGIKLDHKILSGFSVSWCNLPDASIS